MGNDYKKGNNYKKGNDYIDGPLYRWIKVVSGGPKVALRETQNCQPWPQQGRVTVLFFLIVCFVF